MDRLIIVIIIVIYGLYKVVNRICEHKELLKSDIYNVINNLVDENRELMERLLEKEVEDEDRV